MNYEKSKKGLADIYEDDYRAMIGETGPAEEDEAKQELDTLFKHLYHKLDKLSNFHFTPAPVESEAKITTQGVEGFEIEEQVQATEASEDQR